jgi:hypothetical protein
MFSTGLHRRVQLRVGVDLRAVWRRAPLPAVPCVRVSLYTIAGTKVPPARGAVNTQADRKLVAISPILQRAKWCTR